MRPECGAAGRRLGSGRVAAEDAAPVVAKVVLKNEVNEDFEISDSTPPSCLPPEHVPQETVRTSPLPATRVKERSSIYSRTLFKILHTTKLITSKIVHEP